MVAGALLLVAFVLTAESLVTLAMRTEPSSSVLALLAAVATVVILPPQGLAKRRTGAASGSSALQGDGSAWLWKSRFGHSGRSTQLLSPPSRPPAPSTMFRKPCQILSTAVTRPAQRLREVEKQHAALPLAT